MQIKVYVFDKITGPRVHKAFSRQAQDKSQI